MFVLFTVPIRRNVIWQLENSKKSQFASKLHKHTHTHTDTQPDANRRTHMHPFSGGELWTEAKWLKQKWLITSKCEVRLASWKSIQFHRNDFLWFRSLALWVGKIQGMTDVFQTRRFRSVVIPNISCEFKITWRSHTAVIRIMTTLRAAAQWTGPKRRSEMESTERMIK